MDFDKFDIILNADDRNFINDLRDAMGLKDGDVLSLFQLSVLNITTPQFDRVDGVAITYFPSTKFEYEHLHELSSESLREIGCQIWDKTETRTHYLYPAEWYNYIPDGVEVVDIFENVELFKKGKTDNDRRFGALGYGFIKKSPSSP